MVETATKSQLIEESKIFTDSWDFLKHWYHIQQSNDEDWQQMLDEAEQLRKEHNGNLLAKSFVLALIDYIGHVSKGGGTHDN